MTIAKISPWCFVLCLAPLGSAMGEVTDERVEDAIRNGVKYLFEQQEKDGAWESERIPGHRTGINSLCTLALLKSGVKPDDPRIQKALGVIRAAEPNQTYDVALQIVVLCAAGAKDDLRLIQRNVDRLEAVQVTKGKERGGWRYGDPIASKLPPDNSNSAFAVWALDEAARAGAKVKEEIWHRALDYWRSMQNADGSWGYQRRFRNEGSGGMTCSGIASSFICKRRLAGKGEKSGGDKAIQKGMGWLEKHFTVSKNQGARGAWWVLYYLASLRRMCDLTGTKTIGKHDWSSEAADLLVRNQVRLGYWRGNGHGENEPLVGTSLALLVLSRERPKEDDADRRSTNQSGASPSRRTSSGAPRVKPDTSRPRPDPPDGDHRALIEKLNKMGLIAEPNHRGKLGFVQGAGDNRLSDAILKELSGIETIRTLDAAGPEVTDAGMAHIAGMTSLRTLYLSKSRVTDAGLRHLAKLQRLEKLYLGETAIGDEGVKHLKGLLNLKELWLGNTRITDKGLKHVARLRKLTHLWLWSTNITDDGLKHLKALRFLERLELSGTKITDAGLVHLEEMTWLRELGIVNPKRISFEAERRLQRALPRCGITGNL